MITLESAEQLSPVLNALAAIGSTAIGGSGNRVGIDLRRAFKSRFRTKKIVYSLSEGGVNK